MKHLNSTYLRNNYSLVFLVLIILSAAAYPVRAFQYRPDPARPVRPFDHVINRKGVSRISLLTGIPIVATAEYAYGLSDRLTIGVFGGFTPFEEALGLRIRTVVYQSDGSFRIYYCTPVVFYPQLNRQEAEPWWLIRPNLNFEWLSGTGIRYKFGASLIGVASHRSIFGDTAGGRREPELWSAVHSGISLPVGSRWSFQTEVSYITKGMQTVDTFFGGPPVLVITGFSFTF